MAMIRSAGIRGFADVVRELDGDPAALAVEAGLEPHAVEADDVLVDDVAIGAVLEIAAHRLDCPDLGLRVAERQDISLLGPLALAVTNSPTMADALACTARYLFVHAPGMHIERVPDPDGVRGVEALRYDITPDGVEPPRQGIDLSLGSLHRSVQQLAGRGDARTYGLRTVELPGRPLAPAARYEEFFGARVRFARPAALLRLPRSLADEPLTGVDAAVRQLALDFLEQQVPAGSTTLAPRVHGAVRQLLESGSPEVGAVARLLTLHPRTLQRRLAAEGTTFAAVLDAERRDLAHRLLTTTDLPLSRVASSLGFAEQAVLSRAARRWWGTTPSGVRRLTSGAR